jgi:hypothetical protein
MNERDETIKRIKAALKQRSGKIWSVTGGRGTAWGWITIDVPPARRTAKHRLKNGDSGYIGNPGDYEEYDSGEPGGHMTKADRTELASLLGLDDVHIQGVSIPAQGNYRQEYLDRAEGRQPSVEGEPYWD